MTGGPKHQQVYFGELAGPLGMSLGMVLARGQKVGVRHQDRGGGKVQAGGGMDQVEVRSGGFGSRGLTDLREHQCLKPVAGQGMEESAMDPSWGWGTHGAHHRESGPLSVLSCLCPNPSIFRISAPSSASSLTQVL